VKGGMFRANFIAYKISMAPYGYEVKRRYKDFLWLRNSLIREYPGYAIPPMAKKGNSRQFDKYNVFKRMGVLQLFLDMILSHKDLRASIHFLSFLKVKEVKMWDRIKADLDTKLTRISVRKCIYIISLRE